MVVSESLSLVVSEEKRERFRNHFLSLFPKGLSGIFFKAFSKALSIFLNNKLKPLTYERNT